MEAHLTEDVLVTEQDVNRVERAVKAGKPRQQVFPRFAGLGTAVEGTGVTLTVRFSKREGVPVQFVPADDPREAAAVREVDLSRKYHLSANELARLTGLTRPKALALRRHLGIDDDESRRHVFVFGSQRLVRYSDAALNATREALETVDMNEVWERHRPRRAR